MHTYYTYLPGIDRPAEVTADSTKHARTEYLDYLTRNGVIPWNDRSKARRAMILKRVTPGDLPTVVSLSYGSESIPTDAIDLVDIREEGFPDLVESVESDYTDSTGYEDSAMKGPIDPIITSDRRMPEYTILGKSSQAQPRAIPVIPKFDPGQSPFMQLSRSRGGR